MKKTVLITLVVLFLCFPTVYAQGKAPLDPNELGDRLSWNMTWMEVMVLLANKNLEDNNFQWITLDNEQLGKGFLGFYEDEEGVYSYTFYIDENTECLKGVEYVNFVKESNIMVPIMQNIFDVYRPDEFPSYRNNELNEKLKILDYGTMTASDKTVCILGYKFAAGNVLDYVQLSFWDRSCYN